MKGLVLLGRAGSGSLSSGPGEARSASWERLREGTGGGGGSRSAEVRRGEGVERREEEDEEEEEKRSVKAEDEWRESEGGRVLEEEDEGGAAGGARREEPRVRDCVVCHFDEEEEEEEERKSEVRASKGSGFHCASLWIPFKPLVCHPEGFSGCEAGAESDLAGSGGRACWERERGGGLGEARPGAGAAWVGAAAAVVALAVGGACWGSSGVGSEGCKGAGSWD